MAAEPFDRAVRQVIADLVGRQATVRLNRGGISITPRPRRLLRARHNAQGLVIADCSMEDPRFHRAVKNRLPVRVVDLSCPDWEDLKGVLEGFGYEIDWAYS